MNSFNHSKFIIISTFDNSLETQMELEADTIAEQAAAPNGREGIKAFFEKCRPNFVWIYSR